MPAQPDSTISLVPEQGWHCSHFFYRFQRRELQMMPADEIAAARHAFSRLLDPQDQHAPTRLQASLVSGHKADFSLMLLDPDPLRIEGVHQRLMSGPMGRALFPTYSFVSLTEVSEYVPTVPRYADRLKQEGESEGTPSFEAKLKAYAGRLDAMNRQRLTPELPPWPATCFYPMNKKREPGHNWFQLSWDERNRLMAEHGRTGMGFGGKVTQLITVGIGLDDWEWGVTLWSRNPEFLKDIVYRMRFDEASAKYAEFGPFYVSYVMTADEILNHCLRDHE